MQVFVRQLVQELELAAEQEFLRGFAVEQDPRLQRQKEYPNTDQVRYNRANKNTAQIVYPRTENKYSTARSGLLKAARRALMTWSRSKPISIKFITTASNSLPVTSVLEGPPGVAALKGTLLDEISKKKER